MELFGSVVLFLFLFIFLFSILFRGFSYSFSLDYVFFYFYQLRTKLFIFTERECVCIDALFHSLGFFFLQMAGKCINTSFVCVLLLMLLLRTIIRSHVFCGARFKSSLKKTRIVEATVCFMTMKRNKFSYCNFDRVVQCDVVVVAFLWPQTKENYK